MASHTLKNTTVPLNPLYACVCEPLRLVYAVEVIDRW